MKALSQRLETIAALVPKGTRACDIGCDHGYLAIYLTKNNIASSVIAADLNEAPLERARQNIKKIGGDNIELRLCDGLSGINKAEVDTVIIAGMGGNVISGIIDRCSWSRSEGLTFILQPTTSSEVLREFLCKNGFTIVSETVVYENNKLYSVIVSKYTALTSITDEGFYYIGRVTPDTANGLKYIKKQQKRLLAAAEALKHIPEKENDYNHFLSAYNYITKILAE